MARNTLMLNIDLDEGGRTGVSVNELPDRCAACGEPTYSTQIRAQSLGVVWEYGEFIEVVFKCSRNECKRYFLAYYSKVGRNGDYFTLSGIDAPSYSKPLEVPEEIDKISKAFKRIYNQSYFAEKYGLEQVCGGGYRKALEFLLKDYLSHKHPDKSDDIKSATKIGPLLNMIKDPNIKACAERAAWLGNDEAHYLRIWEDKDIINLKELLTLTIYWVKAELLTEKYKVDMNKKGSNL